MSQYIFKFYIFKYTLSALLSLVSTSQLGALIPYIFLNGDVPYCTYDDWQTVVKELGTH